MREDRTGVVLRHLNTGRYLALVDAPHEGTADKAGGGSSGGGGHDGGPAAADRSAASVGCWLLGWLVVGWRLHLPSVASLLALVTLCCVEGGGPDRRPRSQQLSMHGEAAAASCHG